MRKLGYLAVLGMAALAPSVVFADPPPRLDKPGKKVRFISLAEARVIGLEQSRIGLPSLLSPNAGFDNLVALPTASESNSCHARVVCKPGSKGLILTGIRRDPEQERNLNQMLLNVETAYWNLYGSYSQLNGREAALRFAYETWKITEAQYQVGRVSNAALDQAEGQYDLFRCQRLAALETVLDNERQLRAMLGIKIKDGTRLVPSDAPSLVEKKPDWEKGFRSTMKKRPELEMARRDVQLAGWEVAISEELAGIIPLSDGVKQAKSQLNQACLVLQDQELKAERYLGLWQRRINSSYDQIKAARAQREAFATQLRIRYELYRAGANEPGTGNPVTLNLLLQAQRYWADALATECQAVVCYNNALAGWEFAKGDMMKHAHVRLMDEAPDDGNVVRAIDREHRRTRQRVRRESAVPATQPQGGDSDKAAPSLPALWKFAPPLKKVGDLQEGLVERRRFD